MSSIRVDILNPKAAKLLQDLADLNLISIRETPEKSGFITLLQKLRSKSNIAPSLDEITEEVEKVRSLRHAN